LAVTRLDLNDFRNYAVLRLALAPAESGGPVVLTGANGAGKTNLLEALSFLAPGRGLRRTRLTEPVRQVSQANMEPTRLNRGWAVAARLNTPTGTIDIGTGIVEPAAIGEAEKRVVRINGAPASGPAALAEILDIVWLTPQMDRLFTEGPSGRRRFLDRLVYGGDPGHAARVAAYERTMRERNRLLASPQFELAWVDALEDTMAGLGAAIAAARRELVEQMNLAMADSAGPFPSAELGVLGLLEEMLGNLPALAVEDRFRQRLRDNRRRDGETNMACEGPHRSDFSVRDAASGAPAVQGSTGEQKALLISVVLANARLVALRRGVAPLLLLDEVVAHLDAARRAALFDEICDLGAQAWLTGTDPELFAALGRRGQFYRVSDGRVAADRAVERSVGQ
jgi:DNA replication and repair protein RecF